MYWKDYSFYCVPSVNKKADRSWMAYGQRGHTGCNHSPSSGEGKPKSAKTPSESMWRRFSWGVPPTFSFSPTTPDLYLERLSEGSLGKHCQGMRSAAHTPRWKVHPDLSDSFQNRPFIGHWSPPLMTVSLSFGKLDYGLHMPWAGAAKGFCAGQCDSTFHWLGAGLFCFIFHV